MLSKDMVTGIASSPKHIITRIATTSCKTVHPFPHKHKKLHTTFLNHFEQRVGCVNKHRLAFSL